MSAPRNNGPRFFSKAPEPAEVVAARAKAKQAGAGRNVPQVSPALKSAVTQLRTSEQFTEANLRKAFGRYARNK